MFGLQGRIYAALFIGGGVLFGISQLDKSMNYVKGTGTITSVTVDCFVKSGKKRVVNKGTTDLAYMDCDLAPLAAAQFGHKDSAIKKRAKVEYEFLSPVDGDYYRGNFTKEYGVDKYQEGAEMVVYAHKTKAKKSRI